MAGPLSCAENYLGCGYSKQHADDQLEKQDQFSKNKITCSKRIGCKRSKNDYEMCSRY